MICFCSACSENIQEEEMDREEVSLMVTTDLHHLAKELYDENSPIFHTLMETNDGKLFEKSTEILEALKEEAIAVHPDALLLTGDLTFNGEMVSLLEVKKAMEEVEAAGIQVLVIPGNHDISYRYAMRYFGSDPEPVDRISSEQFAEVMGQFGYEEALYRDEKTLAYVYPVTDDFWILTLDANTVENYCRIPEETIAWMETVLKEAQEKGITVVAMSHQNVLIQSTMMYQGYVISNYEEVSALLKKYGVFLALSGHSHLQHTAVSDGLTDICSESIALYPLQYGMIKIRADRKSFDYERAKLDLFEQEADDRFIETVLRMTEQTVKDTGADEAEQAEMVKYASAMNTAYFTGDEPEIHKLENAEGRNLWKKYAAGTFWQQYIENIVEEYN